MALAVKTSPETSTRSLHQQLVIGSLLGAVYVFLSFWVIFAGLRLLWETLVAGQLNEFLADSLLLVVTIPTIVFLFWLGKQLEGPHPQPGVRTGACIGAFLLLLVLLITVGVGNNWFTAANVGDATIGMVLTVVVGGVLLLGLVWLYIRPGFAQWLVGIEESGWFHAISFKPSQGLRVRRGTLIGLLAVGVCGIYTLISHRLLTSGAWELVIPFSQSFERVPAVGGTAAQTVEHYLSIPLMFHLNLTLPVVLAAGLAWFSWRVVNWPKFADFLIATEAEMNKVSWTTRKRLVQDTIVVLITVFLFTLFLFIVDVLWIKILSNPLVDVLKIDPQEERAKQRDQQGW